MISQWECNTKRIKPSFTIKEGHKGGGVLFTVHEENKGPFTVHEENKNPITVHKDNKYIYSTRVVNSWNMCMKVHIIPPFFETWMPIKF